MKKIEIERKFLLKKLPPTVRSIPGEQILQGYLAYDEYTEVRLRQHGVKHFITIKQGSGLKRTEIEESISAAQFKALWPATEGRRVEKIRSVVQHGIHCLEIDRYQGDLKPLLVAEVEFPSIEASELFKKPGYFGQEVTGEEGYRNATLAIHGVPHGSALEYQIGAMPFLFRRGQLHLVIVTNSALSRWIIPKGQPEPNMTRQEVAIMEAMEEAGVIGNFPPGLRAECRRKGEKTLHVYPLNVSTVLKKWPEMAWRKRAILPFAKALKRISDPALRKCLERLAIKLTT